MHLSVRHKLAIALSILSLAVCSGIYLGIKDDFNRGLLFFMNQIRIEDGQALADLVSEKYSPNSFLELAPTLREWNILEHESMRELNRLKQIRSQRRPDSSNLTAPPPPHVQRQLSSGGVPGQGLRPRRGPEFGPPHFQDQEMITPFVPVDLDGVPIYEGSGVDEDWLKIPVNGSQGIIAYIAVKPFRKINSRAEQLFLDGQNNYFLMVTAGALLASILIAWPLVFILLAPLEKLSSTVNSIANRDYTADAQINSSDELGNLSKKINLLATKLARHDQFQSEWLAQISHDLRTPISIMLAEIEAIKDGVYPLTEKTLFSLETEINRLGRQINDLHELSVLKCGEVTLNSENCNIVEMIRDLAEKTKTQRQQKELEFAFIYGGRERSLNDNISPVNWYLDREKIYRVFMNLMQNSIRYSDGPGKIKCNIKTGKNHTLIWEDSKPGVDEEELDKIFDPMFRCEKNDNANANSSGIGLSIVAAIVKLHRGTVKAENIPKQGLRITVKIP